MPAYEFWGWVELSFGRQMNKAAMQGIVIPAVFVIFFYPAAYLEAVIGRYGHVTGVKQAMDVGAKQNSIGNLMGSTLVIRLYMTRFEGRQGTFSGDCASSLVSISDQYAETPLP